MDSKEIYFYEQYDKYLFYLNKGKLGKAYKCLAKLIKRCPDDLELLQVMVAFCNDELEDLELANDWYIELAKARSDWIDLAFLANKESEAGNFESAKDLLKRAKKLQKVQRNIKAAKSPSLLFKEVAGLIEYHEFMHRERMAEKALLKQKQLRIKEEAKAREKAKAEKSEVKEKESKASAIPSYEIPVKIEPLNKDAVMQLADGTISSLAETQMLIDYNYYSVHSGYDDLICLSTLNNIENFWYQTETVKKLLKRFRGRALLCDEVGLGKTIEAGMAVKEYLMRGMAGNVLILTPAPLVSQWKEEMQAKFGINFITTDDPDFNINTNEFWKQKFIIASINTAKTKKNMLLVIRQHYDIVVVDEAHHLRNRATLSWKLVDQLKKKFILLLTATPIQNNLIELFNLITLLKPGQFKTELQFKKEYVKKGNLKVTADREKLRELLSEVMIRNTRSVIDLKLPRRFATTLSLAPSAKERDIYIRVFNLLKKQNLNMMTVNLLLRQAGSSPFALRDTLVNMINRSTFDKNSIEESMSIIDNIDSLEEFTKGRAIIDIIKKNPDEKKLVFTQYIKSMDYITSLLEKNKIPFSTFRGNMTLKEKDASIAMFRDHIPLLVSTESGGEGRNLQFCNTVINFDLPWNPMRIEQRIGRIHRIGQTRDVFIFNLSLKETIEDYIIDILDNKINMFEMVIGEIEPILGNLEEEREFDNIIMDIWANTSRHEELSSEFETLGNNLVNAKTKYLKSKSLDSEIFGDDYEI